MYKFLKFSIKHPSIINACAKGIYLTFHDSLTAIIGHTSPFCLKLV